MCEEINKERVNDNKQLRSVSFLRRNVVLYDERSPDESKIKDVFKDDLQQSIEAIIIVGTRVERFCRGSLPRCKISQTGDSHLMG
jgi:NAD-dependent SIR2 family protein deacetylase